MYTQQLHFGNSNSCPAQQWAVPDRPGDMVDEKGIGGRSCWLFSDSPIALSHALLLPAAAVYRLLSPLRQPSRSLLRGKPLLIRTLW